MGWQFHVRHTNYVAYLTVPMKRPPRANPGDLEFFLGSLTMPYGSERSALISADSSWLKEVKSVAEKARGSLASQYPYGSYESTTVLPEKEVATYLTPLRELLSGHNVYALAVTASYDRADELRAFATNAAYESGGDGLFLIPGDFDKPFDVLDPFPGLALVAQHPESWPGMLFWSPRGSTVFAPLDQARPLTAELTRAARRGAGAVEDVLSHYTPARSGRRLLHLSDLHFGTESAALHEPYLSTKIAFMKGDFDRAVITGDLFNNPSLSDARAFGSFRTSLLRTTGKDPIVIPGNHDQRWLGNVAVASLRQAANLEWSNLVIDDQLECIFLCFDSCRGGNFARGAVTTAQLVEVGTALDARLLVQEKLRRYLKVAVLHHHPFSFETRQETLVQRALRLLGATDERFLRMEDGEEFATWCARRDVPLILHGHKHVPRHAEHRVDVGGRTRTVAAVGCGSSLGAEASPLCYNLISWDPGSQTWGVTFFSDPGDASGFVVDRVSVTRASGASR